MTSHYNRAWILEQIADLEAVIATLEAWHIDPTTYRHALAALMEMLKEIQP